MIKGENLVLYADDDIDDIQLVKEAFQKFASNVELVSVHNGLEAISFLEEMGPDDCMPCLVILDVNMPRMDGKQTLEKMRKMKRFKDVPVVLFTTSSRPSDKEFAYKHNAGFYTKPIEYRQMEEIIVQFVEHCSDEVKNRISPRSISK